MALKRGQLIALLKERRQYGLAKKLEEHALFAPAHANINDADTIVATPEALDGFITGLINCINENEANNYLQLQTDVNDVTNLGAQDWRRLKTTLLIAKACEELKIGNELEKFLEQILLLPLNAQYFTNELLLQNNPDLNNIKHLIKAVNKQVANVRIRNDHNQTLNDIKNTLTVGINLPPLLKIFSDDNVRDNIRGFDALELPIGHCHQIIRQARLAELKMILEPQQAHLSGFFQLLNDRRVNIKLIRQAFSNDPNHADSFQTLVFKKLVALVDNPVNTPAAIASVLNDPGVLNLIDNPNRRPLLMPDDAVLLQQIANQLFNSNAFFSPARNYYINLISSPEVMQQPQLLALLKNQHIAATFVQYWAANAPYAPNVPVAALVSQINTALQATAAAGNPTATRQALAQVLFNATANALDANAADIGLQADNAQTALVNEAKHFYSLKQNPAAAALKTSPAFAKMLVGLAGAASFNLLRERCNFAAITDGTLELTDKDVVEARNALASNFFNFNATPDQKTQVDNLLANAETGPANLSDNTIHQVVGEARLKEYLGETFINLFVDAVPAVLDQYFAFCKRVGAYPAVHWKVNFENEIQSTIINAQGAAPDLYTQYLRGYFWLRKVYGEAFIKNLPFAQLKNVITIIGQLDGSAAKQQRLDNFSNKAVDKADPVVFRTLMGAAPNNISATTPAATDIDGNTANTAIGLLRIQAVFDQKTIYALQKTDPQLVSIIAQIAVTEPLWRSKLSRIEHCIQEHATRTATTPTEAVQTLVAQLAAYLNRPADEVTPYVPALLGNYRAAVLRETIQQAGLPQLADLIEKTEVNGVNPVQARLSQQPLPDDLPIKSKDLHWFLVGTAINAATLPANNKVELIIAFKKCLTGLINEGDQEQFLANLLPAAVPHAIRNTFIDAVYTALLVIVKQYAGAVAAERLKLIEGKIKEQIGEAVDAEGNINQAAIAHFKQHALILKAKTLCQGLSEAADDIAARGCIETFLRDLVANHANIARVVINNNTGAAIADNPVFTGLQQNARRTKIIADIEGPAIAQWLQDYKDQEGRPLNLTYKHVYAINKMLREIGDAVLAGPTLEQKKRLFTQRINYLKSIEELPKHFPNQLFIEANGAEIKAYAYYYSPDYSKKMNILRKIDDPVLRQFALNDSSFLRSDLTTEELEGAVETINRRLKDVEIPYIADDNRITAVQYNQVNNPILGGILAFANFAKNDQMAQLLARGHNRVMAINGQVRAQNPKMADALINNPEALKGNTANAFDADAATHIQAFARDLNVATANQNAFHIFLRTARYDLNGENPRADEKFCEFYTRQFFANIQQMQTSFSDIANFDRDKSAVERMLAKIDDRDGPLGNAETLLNRTNPDDFFMQDTIDGLSRAEAVRKVLADTEIALLDKKNRYENNCSYLKEIKTKLEALGRDDRASDVQKEQVNSFLTTVDDKLKAVEGLQRNCNAAIAKAKDLLETMDKGIANLKKTSTVEGGSAPRKMHFLADLQFNVDLLDPSTPVVNAMQLKYGHMKTEGEERKPKLDAELIRPVGQQNAKFVFTSQDAKTIVSEKDEATLLIESFPENSKSATLAKDAVGTYAELFSEIAIAYATNQKTGDVNKDIEKRILKQFNAITADQAKAAKELAGLLYAYYKDSGSISLYNMKNAAVGALVFFYLYRFILAENSNVKLYGFTNHGLEPGPLKYAAKKSLEKEPHYTSAKIIKEGPDIVANLRMSRPG